MRLIVAQPPHENKLWLFTPAWFDLGRALQPAFVRLKQGSDGFELLAVDGSILSSRDGTLTVIDEDILVDRASIFALDADAFLGWVAQRNQEIGMIPPGDEGTAYHIVDSDNLLMDHKCDGACEFSDAWVWENGLRVNMLKARDIHMGHIRQVRDAKLVQLDIPFLRAVESGDKSAQTRIATQKKILRDIPHNLDLERYTTPAALKAALPSELADD